MTYSQEMLIIKYIKVCRRILLVTLTETSFCSEQAIKGWKNADVIVGQLVGFVRIHFKLV